MIANVEQIGHYARNPKEHADRLEVLEKNLSVVNVFEHALWATYVPLVASA